MFVLPIENFQIHHIYVLPPSYTNIEWALSCLACDNNALLAVPVKSIGKVVRNGKLANHLSKNFCRLEYLSHPLNYTLSYCQLPIITLRLDTWSWPHICISVCLLINPIIWYNRHLIILGYLPSVSSNHHAQHNPLISMSSPITVHCPAIFTANHITKISTTQLLARQLFIINT